MKKTEIFSIALGDINIGGRGVVKITKIDEVGGNNSELKDVVENYYR